MSHPQVAEDAFMLKALLPPTLASSSTGSKTRSGNGADCVLDIIDTAGQEEYSALRDMYTRSADCCIIVFDITSRSSFEEAKLMYEFNRRCRDNDDLAYVLAGNKQDLHQQRQVPEDEAAFLARQWNCAYVPCSAKMALNITDLFENVVRAAPYRADHQYKGQLG